MIPNHKAFRSTHEDRTDGAFNMIEIVCPICECSVHPRIETILPDRDEYDGKNFSWNGRGELIVTALWCEGCDAQYRLLLGNHKGTCLLALVPKLDKRPVYPQMTLAD